MPSVIVLTQALSNTANIAPGDEPHLKAGMKIFGAYYKDNYDDSSAQNAAESIKNTFASVISEGCYVYYWSNHLSKFVRIEGPVRNGVNINFDEDEGGNFKIQVNLDDGGNNPTMNLAAPVGDHTTYLDVFNKLSKEDYETDYDGDGNPDDSTDFFAASILISRCR